MLLGSLVLLHAQKVERAMQEEAKKSTRYRGTPSQDLFPTSSVPCQGSTTNISTNEPVQTISYSNHNAEENGHHSQ